MKAVERLVSLEISSIFIFQLREYPCHITHDIFFIYIPRIILEQTIIYHGYFSNMNASKRYVLWRNQIIVSPFVHIVDTISLFAAELEEPKTGIWGKGLSKGQCLCSMLWR